MGTHVNQTERWKQLNAELAFELTKYIRENEDFGRQIPRGAQLILQLRDDPGFNRWARKVARANRDSAQSAVYVYVERLHASRIAEATIIAA